MADRINIADKETLDLALTKVTTALSNLQDVLSRIGTSDDLSINTLFGLTKVLAATSGVSVVKKVLRGTATIRYNDSNTTLIQHEEVNVNKSVVIFNISPNSSNTNHGGRLIDRTSTTLEFNASETVNISWQIIEFN